MIYKEKLSKLLIHAKKKKRCRVQIGDWLKPSLGLLFLHLSWNGAQFSGFIPLDFNCSGSIETKPRCSVCLGVKGVIIKAFRIFSSIRGGK